MYEPFGANQGQRGDGETFKSINKICFEVTTVVEYYGFIAFSWKFTNYGPTVVLSKLMYYTVEAAEYYAPTLGVVNNFHLSV